MYCAVSTEDVVIADEGKVVLGKKRKASFKLGRTIFGREAWKGVISSELLNKYEYWKKDDKSFSG